VPTGSDRKIGSERLVFPGIPGDECFLVINAGILPMTFGYYILEILLYTLLIYIPYISYLYPLLLIILLYHIQRIMQQASKNILL